MTKDDIIDMAKEAAAKHGHTFKEHPNDAVLEIIAEAYAMGAADERDACMNCYSPDDSATDWMDKIKARSQS